MGTKLRERKRVVSAKKAVRQEVVKLMKGHRDAPKYRLYHLQRRVVGATLAAEHPPNNRQEQLNVEKLTKFINKTKPKVIGHRVMNKLQEAKDLLSHNNSAVVAEKITAPEIANTIASFL